MQTIHAILEELHAVMSMASNFLFYFLVVLSDHPLLINSKARREA